jgi:hypothetical protein
MDESRLVILHGLLANQPFTRESDVVYFLVEVRKLIENLGGRYPTLTFFCDWILHSRMTRKTAKLVLREFDDYLTNRRLGLKSEEESMDRMYPLISLRIFHQDLFYLLAEHGLSTDVHSSLDNLGPFLGLYVDIISKVPLIADDPKLQLRNLDRILVRKYTESLRQATSSDESFAFGIKWLLMKDNTLTAEFRNELWFPASPNQILVPAVRAVNVGGKRKVIPLESKTPLG